MKQNRFFLNRNAQEEGELWSYKKTFSGDNTAKKNRECSVSQDERLMPNTPRAFNGEAYARRTDPDTSEQAAESVRGAPANRVEAMVLEALFNHPQGLTNHEIAEETGLSWNTCTPRIRPLVRKGLVVDSGERRQGCTNRKCVVWKAV